MSLKDLTWVHCTQNVNYDINKNETILNRLLYQIVKSIEITVWYNERLRNDHTLPPYAIFFHKMNLLQHLEIICFITLRFFKKKIRTSFFRPYSCNTLITGIDKLHQVTWFKITSWFMRFLNLLSTLTGGVSCCLFILRFAHSTQLCAFSLKILAQIQLSKTLSTSFETPFSLFWNQTTFSGWIFVS